MANNAMYWCRVSARAALTLHGTELFFDVVPFARYLGLSSSERVLVGNRSGIGHIRKKHENQVVALDDGHLSRCHFPKLIAPIDALQPSIVGMDNTKCGLYGN